MQINTVTCGTRARLYLQIFFAPKALVLFDAPFSSSKSLLLLILVYWSDYQKAQLHTTSSLCMTIMVIGDR